jgi:RNA recognition motif-containing protein
MLRLRKRSRHAGFPTERQKTIVYRVFQQNRDIIRVISNPTLMSEGGKMNRKVYVANLPFQATEPELKTLFSKAGSVMSVKIVKDRQSGQPRGIAFVEMSTQWEGRRAVSMLNRQNFMGSSLLVKEAAEKRGFRGR